MVKKKKLSFETISPVIDVFRDVVLKYTNVKRQGEVAGAALMMFIEASDSRRRYYLERVHSAGLDADPRKTAKNMLNNHQIANEQDERSPDARPPEPTPQQRDQIERGLEKVVARLVDRPRENKDAQ